jgi:DNA-binding MarR family transcriptional regulator
VLSLLSKHGSSTAVRKERACLIPEFSAYLERRSAENPSGLSADRLGARLQALKIIVDRLISVLYKTNMRVDETNFLYTLTNIRQRLFRFLRKELEQEGIRGVAPSYGDILFVLERKGTVTLQEVARHTIKDKSTISSVINKLEAGGYITKARDTSDARYTRLSLTAEAKEMKPALLRISDRMNRKIFQGLSGDEKRTLFRLMEKIYENV